MRKGLLYSPMEEEGEEGVGDEAGEMVAEQQRAGVPLETEEQIQVLVGTEGRTDLVKATVSIVVLRITRLINVLSY